MLIGTTLTSPCPPAQAMRNPNLLTSRVREFHASRATFSRTPIPAAVNCPSGHDGRAVFRDDSLFERNVGTGTVTDVLRAVLTVARVCAMYVTSRDCYPSATSWIFPDAAHNYDVGNTLTATARSPPSSILLEHSCFPKRNYA